MKKLLVLTLSIAVVAVGVVGVATAGSAKSTGASQSIVQIASSNKNFSTLVSLLKKAGLVGALSGKGPFTVFAPTNDAFAKLPKKTLNAVLADKALLKKVLLYHVVSGKVTSSQVVKLTSAKTLEGGSVKIKVKSGKVYINDAQVTQADVMASNGVIHVINRVLVPAS